jgi:quercetin dioxygenase-like cupin family protein
MHARVIAALCLFSAAAAAQKPAGISRVQLLDNPTVMSARLTYAPGAAEPTHTHPFSAVVVQLTPGDADMTIGGEHTRAHRDAGFVWYIPRETPHALVNAGQAAFDQITLALKPDRTAAGSAPATTAPPGITRTTLLDNADARVVRVEFGADGREPVHEHPYDLATVQLTPGRLEILLGTSKTTVDSPAGEVRFLPRNVPHAYVNAGRPFTLLSVAIK